MKLTVIQVSNKSKLNIYYTISLRNDVFQRYSDKFMLLVTFPISIEPQYTT